MPPSRSAVVLASVLAASGLAGCYHDEPVPGAIVAFGDSYTEGTGASRRQAYPALMARDLDVEVVNAGQYGETASEAVPRMQHDVLRHDPRLVVVEFGVNEAYRGYPVEDAIAGQEAILERLAAREIPCVLVGVHYRTYQENFDAGLQTLGARYRCPVVLDVLHGVLEDPALRSDENHPNAAGYKLMWERMRPTVEEALAAADARAQNP